MKQRVFIIMVSLFLLTSEFFSDIFPQANTREAQMGWTVWQWERNVQFLLEGALPKCSMSKQQEHIGIILVRYC